MLLYRRSLVCALVLLGVVSLVSNASTKCNEMQEVRLGNRLGNYPLASLLQMASKCYCTIKGTIGDQCEKCDTSNHYYPDLNNKSCYYDLTINYQFTFNLSKKEDRHYTQINFRNSPIKPDIDVDFFITCSALAKMNITVRTENSEEKPIFQNLNCTKNTFRSTFFKSQYKFGAEENVSVSPTTFYVYVYDFQTPLWIQIAFSQPPKLNLFEFYITAFAALWKLTQFVLSS